MRVGTLADEWIIMRADTAAARTLHDLHMQTSSTTYAAGTPPAAALIARLMRGTHCWLGGSSNALHSKC